MTHDDTKVHFQHQYKSFEILRQGLAHLNTRMNELLFPPKRPESQAVSRPINQEYIQWCDTSINELQKQAVVCALERPQYSPPLIIFGPPGTGKTVRARCQRLRAFYMD